MVQEIYSKIHPVLCTNTHHDVTDLVNHGMVKNTKTWISWEQNVTFLRNKKIIDLCLGWHILRNYRFVAEVTFNHLNEELLLIAATDVHEINLISSLNSNKSNGPNSLLTRILKLINNEIFTHQADIFNLLFSSESSNLY